MIRSSEKLNELRSGACPANLKTSNKRETATYRQ